MDLTGIEWPKRTTTSAARREPYAVRRCFRGPGTVPQQVSLRFDCEPLLG